MNQRRFYALDIFRSYCILVVTFYHVWETSFGKEKMLFSPAQSFFGLLTNFFLDYWGYSGIILAFISFFLIGYSHKRLNWQRFLLVTVGLIGMLVHNHFDFSDPSSWEWNLYGYLFVSIVAVQWIPSNKIVLSILSLISLALLAVPVDFWQTLKNNFSELGGQIVIGDLAVDKTVGWGLLPWLAIPVLGFSIGRWVRQADLASWAHKGFKGELPVLLVLAAVLVALFPFNNNISITNTGFYYYVFSGAPWFFWSRFLVILIWLRLSWLNSVNDFLGRFVFVRWLSGLSWNRHFGLCYFIEFAFMPLALQWTDQFIESPRLMDLFWIFILVATELSTRVITNLFRDIQIATSKPGAA
jgi:hypothetical protein